MQLNKQLEVKRKIQTHLKKKKHLIRIFPFKFMFQKYVLFFEKRAYTLLSLTVFQRAPPAAIKRKSGYLIQELYNV